MALVPFSHASPFTDQLKLRERLFTIDGHLLRIQQAWKGDGKGGTEIGFGASVYPAAYVLAEYLERHPYLVRGKRVIELGEFSREGAKRSLCAAIPLSGAVMHISAEVCLTDGDEGSLRLTEINVRANLPSDRTADAELCSSRQAPGTAGGDDATDTNEPEGGVSGRGKARDGASDADAGGRQHAADRAAKISVQKLRWGCAEDMRAAAGCPGEDGAGASCGRWDVVLGSDIAALPYASAYDELLRTILSLVNSKNKTGSSEVCDSGIGTSASRDKDGDTDEGSGKAVAGASSPVDDGNAAAGSGGGHGGRSLGGGGTPGDCALGAQAKARFGGHLF
ncbi:unnamed protein product [Scytosiphon promiscuus]